MTSASMKKISGEPFDDAVGVMDAQLMFLDK